MPTTTLLEDTFATSAQGGNGGVAGGSLASHHPDTPGSGSTWAGLTTSTFVFPTGSVTPQRVRNNATTTAYWWNDTTITSADCVHVGRMYVEADGTITTAGILAHVQNPTTGTTSGYSCDYGTSTHVCRMFRWTSFQSSSFTQIGSNVSVTVSPGNYIWLRFTYTQSTTTMLGEYSTDSTDGLDGTWHTIASDTAVPSSLQPAGKVGIVSFISNPPGDTVGAQPTYVKTTVQSSSATDFTVTPPAAFPQNTTSGNFTVNFVPGTASAGGTIALSDGGVGGTFSPTSGFSFTTSDANKTFTWTPPNGYTGTPTITVTISGGGALDGISHTANVTVLVGVAYNDANIFTSPYNWKDTGSRYVTANPGAYLKFGFTGTSCIALIDLSRQVASSIASNRYPVLIASVDDGPWSSELSFGTLDGNNTARVVLASGLSAGTHQVELLILGNDNTDVWGSGATLPGNSVQFVGLSLDPGATTAAPTLRTKRMLVYGDSILISYLVISTSGSPALHNEDNRYSFGRILARAFDAEVGIIGNGSQGYVALGAGNVPALPNAWDKYYGSQSRLVAGAISPQPDYVLVAHGTNDGLGGASTGTIQAAVSTFAAALRTAVPATNGKGKIWFFYPFGRQTNPTNAIFGAITPDSNTFRGDLGTDFASGIAQLGTPSQEASDGLHPWAFTMMECAARMAKIMQANIDSVSSAGIRVQRQMTGGLL